MEQWFIDHSYTLTGLSAGTALVALGVKYFLRPVSKVLYEWYQITKAARLSLLPNGGESMADKVHQTATNVEDIKEAFESHTDESTRIHEYLGGRIDQLGDMLADHLVNGSNDGNEEESDLRALRGSDPGRRGEQT